MKTFFLKISMLLTIYNSLDLHCSISTPFAIDLKASKCVGIDAIANAGVKAVALPTRITREQNFANASQEIDTISQSLIEVDSNFETIPFKVDKDLEQNSQTKAQRCLQTFFHKGGVLKSISNLTFPAEMRIRFRLGDAIYPVCSGGWCRSQALWAILRPYSDQIVLFPPHAARLGWDPYNGRINRYRNYAQEAVPDQFSEYFRIEKTLRFGFEHTSNWKHIEKEPTDESLKMIAQFYDQHYFGPDCSWQGKHGKRRIYITFSNNTHVVLYRLVQTNASLQDVIIVAIDSEDLITYPPAHLNTSPRSVKAYEHFSHLLTQQLDFTELDE